MLVTVEEEAVRRATNVAGTESFRVLQLQPALELCATPFLLAAGGLLIWVAFWGDVRGGAVGRILLGIMATAYVSSGIVVLEHGLSMLHVRISKTGVEWEPGPLRRVARSAPFGWSSVSAAKVDRSVRGVHLVVEGVRGVRSEFVQSRLERDRVAVVLLQPLRRRDFARVEGEIRSLLPSSLWIERERDFWNRLREKHRALHRLQRT